MNTYDIRNISGEDIILTIRTGNEAFREVVFKADDVIYGVNERVVRLLARYFREGLFEHTRAKKSTCNWKHEGF